MQQNQHSTLLPGWQRFRKTFFPASINMPSKPDRPARPLLFDPRWKPSRAAQNKIGIKWSGATAGFERLQVLDFSLAFARKSDILSFHHTPARRPHTND